MPAGRLYLYRFVEDAWAGGLRGWCEEAGDSWILVENPGMERWVARKITEAGIQGVRVFDAEGLRDELAKLVGFERVPRRLNTAALVVKVAARQEAAGRSAERVAEASDELARAGWHLNQLGVDGETGRRIHRAMEGAGVLAGIFERRVSRALPRLAARVCCLGWDAMHWRDLGLLDLVAGKAESFEMYVPSPRLPADGLQREWIEGLEQRLGLERAVCPEGGFHSENEALVARLENSELASKAEARAPMLIVGREWGDEVRLVCEQVRGWMGEVEGGPIGVIAPEDSAAAVAVGDALEKAGIRVERCGRAREPGAEWLIVEQAARYHLNEHDVSELMELVRLLWLHGGEAWRALEPEKAREALDRAFRVAQSRNARILARALPHREDAVWKGVRGLVEGLGRWDEEFGWAELRGKWEGMLAALGLSMEISGELWPQIGGSFEHERVAGRAFMEWVEGEMVVRRKAAPPDYRARAPVAVTSFANAAQQSWERLIFLDSNEHVWPSAIAENPFLSDAARLRLNQSRTEGGRLLTTWDIRTLEQARFLDLLEHCSGPVAFAGVQLAQTEAGDQAQPNDWVMRALLETSDAEDPLPTEIWTGSARGGAQEMVAGLDAEERAHLQRVHGSRQNGMMPFDRYQFNFHESKLEPEAWSATDLDEAITCPATFALRELFGAESTANWTPVRNEGAAVGNRAHRWLGRVLGAGDRLARPGRAARDESKLAQEHTSARLELEEWYTEEGLALPLWWETCLLKTVWATRRCMREVRGWLENRFCSMEQKLAVNVRTPNGPILLKGRIDILISDRPEIAGANLRMFDFKTGRSQAPTLSTLERGYGAQFAAYYLMAREAGAAEAVIGIIKPEEKARDVFGPADEENLRARFGHFAELWRNLRFGRRGPLVSDYGISETLPLATVPIDPAILEQKAGLYLLAS